MLECPIYCMWKLKKFVVHRGGFIMHTVLSNTYSSHGVLTTHVQQPAAVNDILLTQTICITHWTTADLFL